MNNSVRSIQDKKLLNKGSETFGEVLQDQVGVLTTNDGVSSYTLGMKNLKSNNELSIDNLVITENSDGTISSQILRYKPSEKWMHNRNFKGLNWDNYSGEIMIYDGRGKLKAVGEFLNGDAIKETSNKEMSGRDDVMDCVVTDVSVAGLEQNGEFYPTDIIIDYHCSSGGGAGGGSDHGLPNGGGEFPHNAGGTHGGGGGSSANDRPTNSPQIPTVIDDRTLFDKINLDASVGPCVEDIINQLKRKDMQNLTIPDIGGFDGTQHLSQVILDLFDKSGDYNLTIKVGQLGTNSNGFELNGKTTPNTNGWNITIDSDLANKGTQLFIAKTAIHETMHAFIGYQLNNFNPLNSDMVADLNSLHQQFKNQNNSFNLTQHEFMSQYVEALAYSLAAWDNHSQSMDYYKMLSWGGLETSTAYQALNNKTNIQNAIQNERYGKSGAKGTKCP